MVDTYPIGTTCMSAGKHPRWCRVVDIWTTTNSAGEVVKVRYVAEHEFCGNTVRDVDVPHTTIARGRPLSI